ncbi:hypothetical protein GOV14_03885 [Candidatus Pacearchaeota archaeon]|nr:hypothetical protein [Candidatus Pacearchaeota archaeon]
MSSQIIEFENELRLLDDSRRLGHKRQLRAKSSFREKQERLNDFMTRFSHFCDKNFLTEVVKEIKAIAHRPYVSDNASHFHSKMNRDVFNVKIVALQKIIKRIRGKINV